MALLGLIILTFVLAVNASLSADYPVNAQLPPVARVLKPFKFVFSEGTFGGTGEEKDYSLENAPSWLHVDSKSRTLSGTPQSNDVGNPKFNLCPSGSVSMEVTLVISDNNGPKPGKPVLRQLEKAGPTSAPSTFFVRPGDSFSISFDSETFDNTGNSTVYYGTSPENSPLPSWMRFDPDTLQFSGTSPAGEPHSFTFNLIASDVAGFSAVTLTFHMAIRPHILSFNKTLQTFTLTRGEEFNSPSFRDILTLDGQKPMEEDMTDISFEGPDWLTMDNKTISLSGTPPQDAKDENVTISITDTNKDVAKMIASLEYSQLFFDDVNGSDATIGEDFSFSLNESVLKDDSAHLEVDLGQLPPSWLHYDADSKTLSGHVPEDFRPQKYTVDLAATKGLVEDTRKFTIDVAEAGHHDQTTDETVDSDSANKTSSDSSGGGGSNQKKAWVIAAAVVIPCVFVGCVIGLFFWRRKRRGAASQKEGDLPVEKPPPSGPDAPLPHCEPFEDSAPGPMPQPGRSPSPSSEPPQLELKPFFNAETFEKSDTFVTAEPAPEDVTETAAADKENARPRSTVGWDFMSLQSLKPEEQERESEDVLGQNKRLSFPNSLSILRQATNRSKKREPLKPIQARRSLKRNSAASSRSKRNSKRSSGLSSVASGLPVRLSGAGHGAGGFGPPGHGVVRQSWQNTQGSLQSDEIGLGHLAPLFPRPPPRARESIEYAKRGGGWENSTISESDSLEAFVHTRAKSRNSSNPMFSGQSNRRPSSGMRALERKCSTLSRADTESTANFTTHPQDDDQWQSVQERPYSTMSGSIYTNDNHRSTWIRPGSHVLASFSQAPSQTSLAQHYRDVISPLPQFNTEASLGGDARRLEDVNEYEGMGAGDYRYGGREHRRSSCYDWHRASSYAADDVMPAGPVRKSPSLPLDDRLRRMRSLRSAVGADKENEPTSLSSEGWRMMSAGDSQELPRDQTGSSYQAFL